MTKTVWKYTVPANHDPVTVEMGKDKKILHVSSTDGMRSVHFWAEHDGIVEDRTFQIFGTGDMIPDTAEYVGTVVHNGMFALVFHLYEIVTEAKR